MGKILFINGCVRTESRTLELANYVLSQLQGEKEEVQLYNIPLAPLNAQALEAREQAYAAGDFSHNAYTLARQFANADTIVIAAPYWDLMFPSVVKTYLENVTVSGITFRYSDLGRPESLCKAKTLYYVTTAGGFIGKNDFGFSYIKALAQNFFGIQEIHGYAAEGLDIFGANLPEIMNKAKQEILRDLHNA
ncbi:MAG: NAD(P)H-dependent oxidoreductase [Clostridia bacterium]|nr:NAD(P)H-dependent oxidoreductase [Clostridia bacterium]